jgi:N-dimethylarginine dimethylaminohydrolase
MAIVKRKMMKIKESAKEPTQCYFDTLKYPAYLVCFPFSVDDEADNNPWMEDEKKKGYNYDKAYREFLSLYHVLSVSSLVYVLPAADNLQDLVYVANLGIVIPNRIRKNTVVISNFRSKPRKGEEVVGKNFFASMGFDVMQCPYWFEGFADLKLIKGNIFSGGYGIRSDLQAYDWFEDNFDMKIVKCIMTDEKLYHYDTQYFPINEEKSLVVAEAFDKRDLKKLEKVTEIIPVDYKYGLLGATNCAKVNNSIFMQSPIVHMQRTDKNYDLERRRADWMNKVLTKAGMELVLVDLEEFGKSGASLSCFVLPLNYEGILKAK